MLNNKSKLFFLVAFLLSFWFDGYIHAVQGSEFVGYVAPEKYEEFIEMYPDHCGGIDDNYDLPIIKGRIISSSELEEKSRRRRSSKCPTTVVEPNYLLKFPVEVEDSDIRKKPNEFSLDIDDFWWWETISIEKAWDTTTGSEEMIVAVMDTGVDYKHKDIVHEDSQGNIIQANIWKNEKEIPNNGIDDDDNGYIDDIYGCDVTDNKTDNKDDKIKCGDPVDINGHGTHVAGIIGAIGNNNLGVAGVNWSVKIMPIKVVGEHQIKTSDVVKGIQYAIDNNAKIINASFHVAEGKKSLALYKALKKAREKGILFVTAAGNNKINLDKDQGSLDCIQCPASYNLDNILTVASTSRNDTLYVGAASSGSNYGKISVDIAAPGERIKSIIPENEIGEKTGTSMATPMVAGVAALLWGYKPELKYQQVRDILIQSVDKKDSLYEKVSSGGRLNAQTAIDKVKKGEYPLPNNKPSAICEIFADKDVIILNGEGSYGEDEDSLSYSWDIKPNGKNLIEDEDKNKEEVVSISKDKFSSDQLYTATLWVTEAKTFQDDVKCQFIAASRNTKFLCEDITGISPIRLDIENYGACQGDIDEEKGCGWEIMRENGNLEKFGEDCTIKATLDKVDTYTLKVRIAKQLVEKKIIALPSLSSNSLSSNNKVTFGGGVSINDKAYQNKQRFIDAADIERVSVKGIIEINPQHIGRSGEIVVGAKMLMRESPPIFYGLIQGDNGIIHPYPWNGEDETLPSFFGSRKPFLKREVIDMFEYEGVKGALGDFNGELFFWLGYKIDGKLFMNELPIEVEIGN